MASAGPEGKVWGPGLPTDAAGSATFPERTLLRGVGVGQAKGSPRGVRQAALAQQFIF